MNMDPSIGNDIILQFFNLISFWLVDVSNLFLLISFKLNWTVSPCNFVTLETMNFNNRDFAVKFMTRVFFQI